jgi:hypothetical protein
VRIRAAEFVSLINQTWIEHNICDEYGAGGRLYALSHGIVDPNIDPSNAVPNTGALFKVNGDGTFTVITGGLDRPTSLEFIGNTAYVVTLTGEI